MSRRLTVSNRQRTVRIDRRRLRSILDSFLARFCPTADVDLAVNIVNALEMTRLNETFLRHAGATDVITFDYREPGAAPSAKPTVLHAEIFVCADVAVEQARRFRSTWPSELVRYVVHGILHLSGYDDHRSTDRRRMKNAEDRWIRRLASEFPLERRARGARKSAKLYPQARKAAAISRKAT